jgi:hypothetical protein
VVKNAGTPAILRALGWPIRDQGLSAFDTQASRLESEVVEMTKSTVVKLFWGSLISGSPRPRSSGDLLTDRGR